MTINTGAFPTNPYHIARAYGVQPGGVGGAGGGVAPVKQVQRAVTTPVQPVQPVSRDSGASSVRDANLQKLVAGIVPGGVSFDASGAGRPTGGALPFYRHPADKNAAATAVSMGRALDVQG